MGFTIATNVSSLNAMRNLTLNQSAQAKSVERLSSGLRINRAADDAAGLAISEGLKNQVSGLQVAGRNAQDGISLVQTAEGALTEVHNILNRVRDLSVQAANDTNNTESRAAIQKEITGLGEELGRIANSTNFNGIQLLDNTHGTPATGVTASLKIQVGADGGALKTANNEITINLANVSAVATAVQGIDITGTEAAPLSSVESQAAASTAIETLDEQITNVSTARADLGATQNRLESTARSIAVSVENLSSANSRIRDTDMAQEMGNFTKSQILSQAATAMLAQANQMNSGVMQLLQ
ncbi:MULTISPECIES: flagellin [unclassified Arthrobacter]|uniref:flagellin N-terminal helical domain-containing protein n=1 Tax=unclassified Arthrobacter TaxID=235627 RepID=UPI001E58FC22|nr:MULTISPECIES: flagellin [unclassified Arthrobacter]MCC9146683.1 flagellin [Arthrobacter sp. zg-Y919]MDK1277913.1 flagellin [Arthrobacter sp. zg.Y919]WIB03493.1 flagellin [Arthrobacter sp. zg-Y919]